MLSNAEFLILPFSEPSFQLIAPPSTPAVLFAKYELEKIVLLLSPKLDDSKYTAPPFLGAELFMKIHSSARPLGPSHMTAPPSPPFPALEGLSPTTLLLVKFEP